MRRTAAALVAVGAAAISGAPDAGAATRIGAHPTLYPKFSPRVHDYVSRCHAGRRLRLDVRAPRAARVRIGSRRARRGSARATLRLRAGQRVRVRIAGRRKRASYHVRCLPKRFPKWSARRRGRTQARFYVVTPAEGGKGSPFVAIFDRNGVPVWWMRAGHTPIDAKLLPNGNLAWSRFAGAPLALRPAPFEERRLDGSLVRRIAAVGVTTDFHDLQVMPNGDYLLLAYVPRDERVDLSPYGGPRNALVLDAVAQQVTPAGRVVWSWNSKDHVATSESSPNMRTLLKVPATLPDGRTAYDLVHVNSIEHVGGSVLLSLAFTNAVYKVRRSTGAVQWKLGGTRTPERLSVTNEPDGPYLFSRQHDARQLRDGTVTLHDNQTERPFGPRAVRYRIDAAARTARRVEQVTDPRITSSFCCGGARRLPGGNWAVSWGFSSVVEELTPKGREVFRLRFGRQLFSYRVVPVPAKRLSIRALRAGMDAMQRR